MKDSTRELIELLAWMRHHAAGLEPDFSDEELRTDLAEHYRRSRSARVMPPGIMRLALKKLRDAGGRLDYPL